jgi:hypothetical protein
LAQNSSVKGSLKTKGSELKILGDELKNLGSEQTFVLPNQKSAFWAYAGIP